MSLETHLLISAEWYKTDSRVTERCAARLFGSRSPNGWCCEKDEGGVKAGRVT